MSIKLIDNKLLNNFPANLHELISDFDIRFIEAVQTLDNADFTNFLQNLSPDDKLQIYKIFATSDFAANVLIANPLYTILFLPESVDKHKLFSLIMNNSKNRLGVLVPFFDVILANITNLEEITIFADKLNDELDEEFIFAWGKNIFASCKDETELMQKLRIWRNFFQTRLIWRDTNHLQSMWQTSKEISIFAKVCLQLTWQFLVESYSTNWGRAYDKKSNVMDLIIIAMGKLGGYELNLSSDIDLIFAYAEPGYTSGGKREKDFQTYFTQLAQKLIHIIDSNTADGFVFRIDMRLRPYGESGALVQTCNAMLNYYQSQGRDWERYAMIKSSVFNGNASGGEQLLQDLTPFVYRKYLDYGAIDAMRQMKSMINAEVNRKNLHDNIKLGDGGIREIEFIVQVWQLIKGGKIPNLRTQKIRLALPMLSNYEILTDTEVAQLLQAYVFFRDLEHSLQQLQDLQTQNLPSADITKTRLAFRMNFATYADLLDKLNAYRRVVANIFDNIISNKEESIQLDSRWQNIWQGIIDDDIKQFMHSSGYTEYPTTLAFLQALRTNKSILNMQEIGRKRLDEFMPLLLAEVSKTQAPDLVLQVVWRLVEAVLRRTVYLVLLIENKGALQQLVKICASSSKMANKLAQMPVLLDELLNPATLYAPAGKSALEDEVRQYLLRSDSKDDGEFVQILNYFRQANLLRIATSDVVANKHIMKVSDYLTYIAEVVLEKILYQSWWHLENRYGLPSSLTQANVIKDFLIVGYGKLGGLEMGYASDLDLVFLHSAVLGQTQGEKSIDNLTFYTRLGQRIIHFLTTTTNNGSLYEVDMRLRPSGNSGLLVSSISAFEKYQQESAWLWEHQALVKARPICGDAKLAEKFIQIRRNTLIQKRDLASLKREIKDMRQKMRDSLSKTELLEIKYSQGGMIDIEFLAQFCVLAYSYEFENLTLYTDVMRILDEVEKSGIKDNSEVKFLQKTYLMYRQVTHRDYLSDITQTPDFTLDAREVIRIWDDWLKI